MLMISLDRAGVLIAVCGLVLFGLSIYGMAVNLDQWEPFKSALILCAWSVGTIALGVIVHKFLGRTVN